MFRHPEQHNKVRIFHLKMTRKVRYIHIHVAGTVGVALPNGGGVEYV